MSPLVGGIAGFTQYRPVNRSAFWGFYAAPPDTGTRLCADALDEAFGSLNRHELNGEALASNERSAALHRKLGFDQEGPFRDHHYNGERFVDAIRFGILASEWFASRAVINAKTYQG